MQKWLMKLQAWDEQLFFSLSLTSLNLKGQNLARAVSRSGDGYYYFLLVLMLYWSGHDHGKSFLLALATGFAIELPLYWLLKNTLRRRRPYQKIPTYHAVIQAHDTFSFPSGHTTAAFMFAGLSAFFVPLLAPLIYLWAACIGWSRIRLGVHFPTDILAGAGLGSVLALLVVTKFLVY